MDSRDLIIYYAIKYKGRFKDISHAIFVREKCPKDVMEADIKKEINEVNGVQVVTGLDTYAYPSYLQRELEPTLVYFYKGKNSLLKNQQNNVAVLSSHVSRDDEEDDLLNKLSDEGKTVVLTYTNDEMFDGIRTIATKSLLRGLGVILVLPKGFGALSIAEEKLVQDIVENKGLVISVFPSTVTGDDESDKITGQAVTKICQTVLLDKVETYDVTNAELVATALDAHKRILGIVYKDGKDILNSVLYMQEIMQNYEGVL